jgi:CPA2 family monovalent cation:H+ antiporter-2
LPQILGVAVALIAVKSIILWAAARTFGVSQAGAVEIALLLPQAGEFGFAALAVAVVGKVIEPGTAQFLTATIALTMIATPLLARMARQAGSQLERRKHEASRQLPDQDEMTDHVIIGGFGRVGQTIARLLAAENVEFVALDLDARLVDDQRKQGHAVYFGDASRAELLERAGASRARAFIVTLDEADAAERMVRAVRGFRADAIVLARAMDRQGAKRLIELGAIEVVPETFEASLQLGGRTLEVLGASDDAVAHRLATLRDQFEQAIKADTPAVDATKEPRAERAP